METKEKAFAKGEATRAKLKVRACGFHHPLSVANNPHNGLAGGHGKRMRAAWHNGWLSKDKEMS